MCQCEWTIPCVKGALTKGMPTKMVEKQTNKKNHSLTIRRPQRKENVMLGLIVCELGRSDSDAYCDKRSDPSSEYAPSTYQILFSQ